MLTEKGFDISPAACTYDELFSAVYGILKDGGSDE